MKGKIFHSFSIFLLLTFIFQLAISSSIAFFPDDNPEENIEIGLEDLSDEESDEVVKLCFHDWISVQPEFEFTVEDADAISGLSEHYYLIDQSIPVPPPEKMV